MILVGRSKGIGDHVAFAVGSHLVIQSRLSCSVAMRGRLRPHSIAAHLSLEWMVHQSMVGG